MLLDEQILPVVQEALVPEEGRAVDLDPVVAPRPRFLLRVIRLLRWQSVTLLLVFRNHPPRDVLPGRSHSGYGPVAQFPGHGYRSAGGQRAWAWRWRCAGVTSTLTRRGVGVASLFETAIFAVPLLAETNAFCVFRCVESVPGCASLICEQHSGLAVKGGCNYFVTSSRAAAGT